MPVPGGRRQPISSSSCSHPPRCARHEGPDGEGPNGPVRFCSDDCRKEAYYGRPEWLLERRDYNARFNFNLPPGRYIEMVREQDGVCAIAGCTNEAVSVDHDHRCCDGAYSCGRCVRAILCLQCNAGMGMLRDDPALVRAAADYLDTWNTRTAPPAEP